jgi:regulation of enolase protein 1 (concanavalin A-like superfamily)
MPQAGRRTPQGTALLAIKRLVIILVAIVSLEQVVRSSDPVVWVTSSIGPAAARTQSLDCSATPTACPIFQVTAAGSSQLQDDVYGFVSRRMAGDGFMVARLGPVVGVSSSLTGLMIRGATTVGSPYLAILRTASGGLVIRRRYATGATVTQSSGVALAGVAWLRMERQGDAVTLSQSIDGTGWRGVWSGGVDLPDTASLGVAITSQRPDAVSTALISDLRLESISNLPSGWTSAEVGGAATSSLVSVAGGSWTMVQSGATATTQDQPSFVYQRVTGDTEIIARQLVVSGTSAQAGVMVRESLASGSPFAWIRVATGGARSFRRRHAAGMTPSTTSLGSAAMPAWHRLVRQGDVITVYQSPDGLRWTTLFSDAIDLPDAIYVGMAVARSTTSAVGAFDNVTVQAATANVAPSISMTAPVSGTSLLEGQSLAMTAAASDADDRVEAVEFQVDGRRVGVDTASPYGVSWISAGVGFHTVTALARDSDGAVVRSSPVTVSVLPSLSQNDDETPLPSPLPSTGPWRLVFEPSVDHDRLVDRYTAEIYALRDFSLVMIRNLGKPAVVSGQSTVDLTEPISGLPAGDYQIFVRAVDDAVGVRSIPGSTIFRR